MSQRGWSVRPSVPEDLDAIRELFLEVFKYVRPLAHDIWKFRDNPVGPGIGVVATDSGRIVGQYVLLPTQLRLGKEVVVGAQSLDTMTHPDYRGQGMFVTLAEACMGLATAKGVEALYGFPNANSFHGFIRRLNWDHTGDVPRWVRILNPWKAASLPTSLRPIAALGVHLLPRGKSVRNGIEIKVGRPSEHELESLLADWRTSEDLCRIERSLEWLKWRFAPESDRGYEWVTAYRDGSARAYAIWGLSADVNSGFLSDLFGSDCEALEAAVSFAVRRATMRKVGSLMAVTNQENAVQALKSCGFIRRKGLPLIVRSMTARNLDGNIHDHASWRILPADIDIF